MTTIQIDSAEFQSRMGDLLRRTRRPRSIVQAMARGGRKVLRAHFRQRDRAGNQLGGKRTHFWLDVYKSTQLGEVTDHSAAVNIGDHRFPQKVYGGTIRPKEAKAISVPVAPEAHGRRPATLEQELGIELFLVPREFGSGLLAATVGDKRVKVFYVLRQSVEQDADPRALPERRQLEDAALAAADRQLNTELQAAKLS